MQQQPVAAGPGHPSQPFSLNAVLALTNVLFFVVVQTLFFWFIASREVDRTVKRKAELLEMLRRNMAEQGLAAAVQSLDGNMNRVLEQSRAAAERDRQQRESSNRRLTLLYMGPLVLVLGSAIGGLLWYNRRQQRTFGLAQWVGLFLVAFVYVFEVLFFLLVVENYIMVGDCELLQQVTGLQ